MRFMMLMIPGVYQDGAVNPDMTPDVEMVEKMTRFNEEMATAGVMLSGDGLMPLSKGARVTFDQGKPVVTDGEDIKMQNVLGGFWMLKVKSKEEAVEWARKVPALPTDVIEVRQVFEFEDWPEDIQKAAESPILKDAMG